MTAAMLVLGVFLLVREGSNSRDTVPQPTFKPAPPPKSLEQPTVAQSGKHDPVVVTLEGLLGGFLDRLKREHANAQTARATLDDIKRKFLDADPTSAVAVLLKFLETNENAPTGLGFVPGEGGLKTASSFRVFLLDLLGSVDPSSAEEYAQSSIFPKTTDSEEYAVALRNASWNDPLGERTEQTQERLGTMLSRAEWLKNPSQGFLEAFDGAVAFLEPEEALPLVAKFAAGAGPLKDAAVLALQRMAVQDTGEVIDAITSGKIQMEQGLKAELLSRADFRKASQMEAIHDYLAALNAGGEASAFFAAFPNHTYSVAPGLFRQPAIPDAAEMRDSDLAARQVLAQWVDRGELDQHRAQLVLLLKKLNENAKNVDASR